MNCIVCNKELKNKEDYVSLDYYSGAVDTGIYLCNECARKDTDIDSLLNLEYDLGEAYKKMSKAQEAYCNVVIEMDNKIKKMKKFFILIMLLFSSLIPANALVVDLDRGGVELTRGEGYYMDGRGQVPEYSRIAPPHEENIPQPRATKTVVPWDRYYDINKEGYRPMGYQMPLVPNYNYHYSNRRAKPYTTSEYVAVWCSGEPDYNKRTCTTEDKVYYYYNVRNWAYAVAGTPFRDLKRGKDGKSRSYVFYVEELGLDAEYMYGAKQWAELFDMDIHFVTIDSYIPTTYLL